MKRLVIACVVLLLAAGSVHATNYSFVGTRFATVWDNADNWSPTLVLPGTTGDGYTINGNYTTGNRIDLPSPGAAATRYFGSITADNGLLGLGNCIYRLTADNGHSGSFIMTGRTVRFGTRTGQWNERPTIDLDGDFIYDPVGTGAAGWQGLLSTVRMRGANVTFKVESSTESYNCAYRVVVDNGAGVNFATDLNGGSPANTIQTLDVWGAAGGSVRVPYRTDERVKALGAGGDTSQLDVLLYPHVDQWPTIGGRKVGDGLLVRGRFRDVEFGALAWNATASDYTAHLPGDLRVRNFRVGYSQSGSPAAGINFLLDTDNHVLTVDGDLTLGPSSTSGTQVGILRAGSSAVKVGGTLNVKYNTSTGGSYILGGTSTFRVGKNWTVDCGTSSAPNWNMGASRVIFDGNGTTAAQTIKSGLLPFNDVEINNPGGAVNLADNLVLKGDFTLTAGAFTPAGYYLVFKGGIDCETLAQEIDVNNADLHRVHVKAGSSSFAKLMSDLTVADNLDVDAGCKLFLNGFTLTAEGHTYEGTGTWTVREGGEIVGAGEIPEPATLMLVGTGALVALGWARRRRMKGLSPCLARRL